MNLINGKGSDQAIWKKRIINENFSSVEKLTPEYLENFDVYTK
jgi:hypothetical protein